MKLLNYTGLPVSVKLDYSGDKILSPDGKAELLTREKEVLLTVIDHIQIYKVQKGGVINLPKENWNLDVLYLVTQEVADAVSFKRSDLVVMTDPVIQNNTYYTNKLIALT